MSRRFAQGSSLRLVAWTAERAPKKQRRPATTTPRRLLVLVLAATMSSARAAMLASVNAGKEFLKEPKWAVIGDVLNPAKPASTVVQSLKGEGKTVHLVNPRDKSGQCFATVSDIGEPFDVLDLCINHIEGLRQVQMLPALGVKKVFIQPGAGSPEILDFCKSSDIEVFQGCVMVELGVAGH